MSQKMMEIHQVVRYSRCWLGFTWIVWSCTFFSQVYVWLLAIPVNIIRKDKEQNAWFPEVYLHQWYRTQRHWQNHGRKEDIWSFCSGYQICVCVRQNVVKQHNFSKIVNIWTFHQNFDKMLTTCTTKNHVITIGLPQTIDRIECPVPYILPIPYSKYIWYKDLPDANGWDDDDLVRKTCGPNWCKNDPELFVSKSVEEEIEAKKKELGYNETYDKDQYLQEMVLCSLHMVFIFGCSKPLIPECKWRSMCYQDELQKSSVRIFGKCSFDKDILNSHDKIAKYLRKQAIWSHGQFHQTVFYQRNQVKSIKGMGCHPKIGQVKYLPNWWQNQRCDHTFNHAKHCWRSIYTFIKKFMETTRKHWWQTFCRIYCLHLTSAYGIILLLYCLHAKNKCILELATGVVRMKHWINFKSFLCNASLFLITMIISVF